MKAPGKTDPQRAQHGTRRGRACEVDHMERSAEGGIRALRRYSALLLERVLQRRLLFQAFVDLDDPPALKRRRDRARVHVELLVPLAVLVDRAVAVAQERIVDAHLVVPDL